MDLNSKMIGEKSIYFVMITVNLVIIYFNLSVNWIFVGSIMTIVALILLGENSWFPFTDGKRVHSWIAFYAAILILVAFVMNIINNEESSINIISATIVSLVIFGIISAKRGWYLRWNLRL